MDRESLAAIAHPELVGWIVGQKPQDCGGNNGGAEAGSVSRENTFARDDEVFVHVKSFIFIKIEEGMKEGRKPQKKCLHLI